MPAVSRRPCLRAAALALVVAAGLAGSEAAAGVDTTAPCTSSDTRLCVGEGRFEVGVEWQTPAPRSGNGRLASLADGGGSAPRATSSDSALFWFFQESNWEALVKVLDGCRTNDHFWVFAAATTNVGYTLEVTDTWSGEVFQVTNPVGVASRALTQTRALGTCSAPPPAGGGSCVPSAETACLHDGRFQVTIDWRDGSGGDGRARVAELPEPNPEPPAALPVVSADSGVFWFFRENNWEMLVKVLDGCATNDRFWVFSAAMTNVGYTLSVTDRWTGETRRYTNPEGIVADALTDTAAFASCEAEPPSTAEVRLVSARDHIEGQFLTNSTIYADREHIYLASYPGDLFILARDREADFPLIETLHLSEAPLRAVRGDGERLYVSGDEGVIWVFRKSGDAGSPLELVRTLTLADLGFFPPLNIGLLHLAIRDPWLYVSSRAIALGVNDEHVFLGLRFLESGAEFAFRVHRERLDQAIPFDFTGYETSTAVFDRHTGEPVTVLDDPNGVRLYADTEVLARMCCHEEDGGVFLADSRTLTPVQNDPLTSSAWAMAAVRKGPWLIVGDEYGRVYLVDLRLPRPHGVAGVGLRHATGHTELGAIEIRALWVDEHDDLIFAGSSWGDDTTRGPELPSFFVLELVEDP